MEKLKDFIASKTGCEIAGFEFGIVAPSGKSRPSSVEEILTGDNEFLTVKASYGDTFTDELFFRREGNGLVCERRTKNISRKTARLCETFFALELSSFGKEVAEDYFYHTENPRIYDRMAIPVDKARGAEMIKESAYDPVAGNKWIDSYDACERIGFSPYQPFPAILLSNFASAKGLVHGTLSQKVFYHNYTVKHVDALTRLDVFSSFKAIDYRELRPGEALEDCWWLGVTDEAADIEKIFAGFITVLRTHIPVLYGASAINRHSCVWGSWNDGIFRDIDEARLVNMAEYIATAMPTVKWLQVDDGYATYAGKPSAHGLGAPYEEHGGTDLAKFPDNLCGFTSKVRQFGVRPAVWIGGFVPGGTPLRNDKPEWFADYGFRPCLAEIPPEKRPLPLDVSKPEVREYMCKAIDFLLSESGFQGMKHDFWSYVFEDSRIRLANREKSGYEWRTWWLQELRKRLPDDAYLQTGCDIVMANPFLAQYFTNYRYGIDIGSGSWENVVTNFIWGTACFALHIGDMFVPNSDSVGLFPGLSDTEALFCINYCLISRSMVEVAGWLYKEEHHPRMKWLRKSICCPNNGQDVYFAGYEYRNPHHASPEVWYIKTPHFSLLEEAPGLPARTFAVFNMEDTERSFTVKMKDVGVDSRRNIVTDVWNLNSTAVEDTFEIKLQGHSSALCAVTPMASTLQLLDANMKVISLTSSAAQLSMEFAYAGKLDAILNFKPGNVSDAEGNTLEAHIREGVGNWILECDVQGARTVCVAASTQP